MSKESFEAIKAGLEEAQSYSNGYAQGVEDGLDLAIKHVEEMYQEYKRAEDRLYTEDLLKMDAIDDVLHSLKHLRDVGRKDDEQA